MQNPFPIFGFVPAYGANVKVVGKNLTTGEEEEVFSDIDGSFIVDAANMLPTGYSDLGDIIRVTAPELNVYGEVICDPDAYPDGREVSLTKVVSMATIIPSGVMAKFPTIMSKIQGNVSVERGGLG